MPTAAREQAYAALWTVLNGISGIDEKARDPNWSFKPAAVGSTALALVDGGEDLAPTQQAGRLLLLARAEVFVACWSSSTAAVAADLNELSAAVRAALWADRTLGGVVAWVEYDGCSEPALLDPGSPAIGAMTLALILHRTEADSDPYSLG